MEIWVAMPSLFRRSTTGLTSRRTSLGLEFMGMWPKAWQTTTVASYFWARLMVSSAAFSEPSEPS